MNADVFQRKLATRLSKMAEARISWSQDEFSCSICLNVLKEPVTIPCGHSYCMSCITVYWDQEDQKRVYSCPQCRQTFTPRPVLGKNTMLAEVVEKLKKTKLQAAHPAQYNSEPADMKCDVCTGRKYQAVKSCLVCLNSFCKNHLEQHENLFKSKRHNLIAATPRLQQMICPQHDKLLDLYCRTDHLCICTLCMVNEHKTHDTVLVAEEWKKKQKLLDKTQEKFRQKIQERQEKIQELRETVESHKRSAQSAVKDSERIFTELIRSIERSRSEVTQLIRDQEKAAVSRAEGLLERLEQEIADLRKRDAELEQLSHTEDHIHFLKSFQSLFVTPESADSAKLAVSSLPSFDGIEKSVSHLKEQIEDFCKEEIQNISDRVTTIEIISNPEPKRREEFLQYFRQFNPDENTVHKNLCLSEGNRVIATTRSIQPYPDHPDRFDYHYQVLSKDSVCGRCYWEVERIGWVGISVSYKSISRKGRDQDCEFGCNGQSWSLFCSDISCTFWHNNINTKLPVVPKSSKIGVYLDHSAGTLSFYNVSDTMTLIHSVHTAFTQPLYPGFWFNYAFGSWFAKATLCDLKI
ncbi:tripartite motif-containing protein 16-like protein isoform X2 [Xyrauchen texanus]|uniref:tripartite motif-containing protein 16-like protein isoform X2 n=1 Tax=Xyrauchen texanus TaxID=154827 RepID=UPI002242ADEA|nr:tripartite motif-containing protein 16-like protein isoform X2 [Xyrauchen texanus]